MGVPVFEGKHGASAIFSAEDVLRSRSEAGLAVGNVPPTVILTWQAWLFDEIGGRAGVKHLPIRLGQAVSVSDSMAIALLPPGAPIVAMAVEELSAQGAKTVIGVGTAGGLSYDLTSGEVVLSSAALRDEGTSHHYAPAAPLARPNAALVDRLARLPMLMRLGATWTTDAPYRETRPEVDHHRACGFITVDMESAALLTVAQYRGAAAASIFCIGDTLCEGGWRRADHPRVRDQLRSVLAVLADDLGRDPARVSR